MPAPERTIVAIVADHVGRARIVAAAESEFRVEFCDRAPDAIGLIRSRPVGLLVVAARDAAGTATAPTVAVLHDLDPALRIVAYGRAEGPEGHALFALATCGARAVVIRDREDAPEAFRSVLHAQAPDQLQEKLESRICSVRHPGARAALSWLLHATGSPGLGDLARALSVTPRTLLNWFATEGLRSPAHVIALLRLLRVALAARDPRRTFEGLASTFGFASVANLRKSLHRHARLTLHDLRAEHSIGALLHLLIPVRDAPNPNSREALS